MMIYICKVQCKEKNEWKIELEKKRKSVRKRKEDAWWWWDDDVVFVFVVISIKVGDGNGERVTQLHNKRVLVGKGDRSWKAHSEREFHGWRLPVGHLFLPWWEEPRRQLHLCLCLHRSRQWRHRRPCPLWTYPPRPNWLCQAQGS